MLMQLIRHRRNLIVELLSSDGTVTSEHREKEQILWEDFKIRVGTSEFDKFAVDPYMFVQRMDNLNFREEHFAQELRPHTSQALGRWRPEIPRNTPSALMS